MRFYFTIQFKIINRSIKAAGLNVMLGYVLCAALFVGLSLYLFHKTSLAEYLYALIALVWVTGLSEKKRNDFLKLCFPIDYLRIRLMENLLYTLPFLLLLVVMQRWMIILITVSLTILLAKFTFSNSRCIIIPTPFYKRPFEFIVGFRKAFLPILGVLSFSVWSIFADNINLSIFSGLLMFLICLSFYLKEDDPFFVWSYSLTPLEFLKRKLGYVLKNVSILVVPLFVITSVSYQEEISTVLLFYFLGYLFVVCVMLAKYAAFPAKINVVYLISLALCIYFPPLLVVIAIYFYYRSLKQIKNILK
jgi:hypothetical protein